MCLLGEGRIKRVQWEVLAYLYAWITKTIHPGCRIVGSHTRWELTTWADFQLCLHRLLMSSGCSSSKVVWQAWCQLWERSNSSIFRQRRKMSSDSEDCTAVGKLFHTRAAVELNARHRWSRIRYEEHRVWPTTMSVDAAGNQRCSPVAAGRWGNAAPCCADRLWCRLWLLG